MKMVRPRFIWGRRRKPLAVSYKPPGRVQYRSPFIPSWTDFGKRIWSNTDKRTSRANSGYIVFAQVDPTCAALSSRSAAPRDNKWLHLGQTRVTGSACAAEHSHFQLLRCTVQRYSTHTTWTDMKSTMTRDAQSASNVCKLYGTSVARNNLSVAALF